MTIIWSDLAFSDLEMLYSFIAVKNPFAANRLIEKILKRTDFLALFPKMGRTGKTLNTRELIITNTSCIVPYQIQNNTIEIAHVFHQKTNYFYNT